MSTRANAPLSLAELVEWTTSVADDVRAGLYDVRADTQNRWHVRLLCDDQVDVWLISWTSEQGTQLHDHGGSAGAFTVVEGQLEEAIWHPGPGELGEHHRVAGDTVVFGEHYVHDVRNTQSVTAVSVHAYSPPLSSMRFYDVDHGQLTTLAHVWTDDPEEPAPFESVDALLEDARSHLARVTPQEAYARTGAIIVDIRPAWQRAADGEIPGSVVVERNHLEWRLHPASGAALPMAHEGQEWIVVCTEGYTSPWRPHRCVRSGSRPPTSSAESRLAHSRAAGRRGPDAVEQAVGPSRLRHRMIRLTVATTGDQARLSRVCSLPTVDAHPHELRTA